MRIHIKSVLLVAALCLSGIVRADHLVLQSVKTEAQVRDATTTPIIEVDVTVDLQGLPPDPIQPVVLGWEAVGGIDPDPFLELTIPAGCLDSDFMAGCAEGRFIADGATTPLTIRGFDARFFARDDGSARFSVTASFLAGDLAHLMLSTLAGRAVEVTIGAEFATALTTGIEAVSGIDPEPFQPVPDGT